MAAINWTRLLVILLTILVALVLVSFAAWIVLHFIGELLLLFMAAILAYLLAPVVEAVRRRVRLPRPLCILLVYLALGACLLGVGFLFAPVVVGQARALQTRLPSLLQALGVRSADLERALRAHGVALPLGNVAGNATGAIGNAGPGLIGNALTFAASLGTTLLDTVLVLVMSFYLINDHRGIGRNLAGIVPPRYAAGTLFATRSAGRIIGRYVRAQILVALMVGLLGGGGAAALGVQYAPLIGIFAFFAESIPVLGPIIATVPAVLIALVESPWKALAVLAWFVVVQQLEQNLIMPRLSGHAVGIHPIAAIMAVLIGFSLGSVWGALFAVPLLGFAYALAREVYRVYVTVPADDAARQRDDARARAGAGAGAAVD
jgi:predicted PurR-regulated permease PerM